MTTTQTPAPALHGYEYSRNAEVDTKRQAKYAALSDVAAVVCGRMTTQEFDETWNGCEAGSLFEREYRSWVRKIKSDLGL
jgi:hypothetical protein